MRMRKNNSFLKNLTAILFCLFIGLMLLLFLIFPKGHYSSNEKRYLNAFPQLTLKTVFDGSFGKEFEAYLSDQAPYRELWVGLNGYYNLYSGRNGVSGVYSCDDNYLINVPINTNDGLTHNIKVLADFAESTGISTTLLAAPTTGYIMEDLLPLNHLPYMDDENFKSIYTNKGDMQLIDIRSTFKLSLQQGNQLYYKTDHHWTTLGAYTAYTKYCDALGLIPTPQDSFNINTYNNFYGTTYSKSALWLNPPDTIDVWTNKSNKNIRVKIIEADKTKAYNNMFFTNRLNDDDKYPVFLDGNHSVVKIINPQSQGGRLLVIKDSYAHCFVPFLSEHYSEIIMVDLRYYNQPVSQMLLSEGIDSVLVLYSVDSLATDKYIKFLR